MDDRVSDSSSKYNGLILNQGVVLEDGSTLMMLSVKRYLPNRRIVCRAIWNNQTVFAKLFFGKNCKRYATRDKLGVEALEAASIRVPAMIKQLVIESSAFSAEQGVALIYEAIEPAINAEELLQVLPSDAGFALMQKLIEAVAQHHQAGLVQTDLYLKNFLVHGDVVYTIDGDGIRHCPHLTHQQSLQNLSILLSKLDVIELETQLHVLLLCYTNARGWSRAPNIDAVKRMIARARERALFAYADKKVFRTCTDVTVLKDARQFGAYANQFFDEVESLSATVLDDLLSSATLLKSGNTCSVGRVLLEGKPVVIKRYNVKGFWHGVDRALRKSRAEISWANAHRLQLLGIPTPQAIALVESYRFTGVGLRLKGKAYFISAYVDALDVAEFFTQTSDKAMRADAVKQLATMLYRLYLLKLSHGDMKASNIKMQKTTPMLIDLDAMRQHHCAYFAQKAHARDIKRFMQNWKHDTSLYNAFIKALKVVYANHKPLRVAGIL